MAELLNYINYTDATIKVLRDYHDKQWKIENDPKRVKEIADRLVSPRPMTSVPVHGGGSKWEDDLCTELDRQALITRGYKKAVEYSHEIEPCLAQLTEKERDLLTLRFINKDEGNGIKRIMTKYGIEKSKAYALSNAALDRLTMLIY